MLAPRCKDCGEGTAELRRNTSNNGVGWQCRECNAVLSGWLPHHTLADINLLTLPLWDRSARNPRQPGLL